MASLEHWEVQTAREMCLKVVGKEEEDRRESFNQAVKIFRDIPAGHSCLEIGCGYGRFAPMALTLFNSYLGVDVSRSILAYAPRHQNRMAFFVTNGRELPFARHSIDFVFSFTCFQHMPDLETIRSNLAEAHRVLLHGGQLRFQTVIGKRDTGEHDGYVFESPEELMIELISAGFPHPYYELENNWVWMNARKG